MESNHSKKNEMSPWVEDAGKLLAMAESNANYAESACQSYRHRGKESRHWDDAEDALKFWERLELAMKSVIDEERAYAK